MDEQSLAILTEKVLQELKQRLPLETSGFFPLKKALVLGKLTAEEERQLSSVYAINFIPEHPKEWSAENNSSDLLHMLPEFDVLVAAQLSMKSLALSALACPSEKNASLILSALLAGKKVIISKQGLEYRNYRESAPKVLYRRFKEYEDTLKNFGAVLVPDMGSICLSGFPEKNLTQNQLFDPSYTDTRHTVDFTSLHVLGEADVIKARKTGARILLVSPKVRITPLAMDCITNLGLTLQQP